METLCAKECMLSQRRLSMANVAANLPATHPTSMFYLYLKSSVQLFTTQFCLIYVTAPLFPGRFRKKTNS